MKHSMIIPKNQYRPSYGKINIKTRFKYLEKMIRKWLSTEMISKRISSFGNPEIQTKQIDFQTEEI